MEMTQNITKSVEPILKQQGQMQRIVDATRVNIPDISIPTSVTENLAILHENTALKALTQGGAALKAASLGESVLSGIGEMALSSLIPNYTFTNPYLDKINSSMTAMLQTFNDSAARLLADSVSNIVGNLGSALLDAVCSPAIDWLQSIDFTPMFTFLENLHIGTDALARYKEFNQVYLMAMYECKWFPYAGWMADLSLMAEVSDIIATSRGKSKRREQRVDKAILTYYTPKKIKDIKRTWKKSDLEPHIKKILGQAIESHLRGEYVLTITCLATMWEGLIHQKLHINGRYSQKKTKEDFVKLIDENDYEPIFSEFYEKLIVSQCDTPEQVIEGIPNRNGVSHSKYKKYPNKKASLNAILLTDFIIGLKPKTETEEI